MTTDDHTTATELGQLSEQLTAELLAYFRRRTDSVQDAEDLLQETLLRVYQQSGEIREADRLPAWVFRIARNLLVDERRRRRLPTRADVEEADNESEDGVQNVVAGWLDSFIEQLDPKYRDVIRQSEIEGIPHREIAENLGLSVSAIKSRVQRGREQMHTKLTACCQFELDRRGKIIDYERRRPDGGCVC